MLIKLIGILIKNLFYSSHKLHGYWFIGGITWIIFSYRSFNISFCVLDTVSENLLKQAINRLKLSARAYHCKLIKCRKNYQVADCGGESIS